ncbi:protein KRI1 homolog isoform X1 [Sitophilus oryzae]|uniref:Protein KRI1 homolog n=1 Tax=Sitophilus oryzae TaxID=7048 RepID=A0A6J2YU44_SITOR|nr:protein KRI1 homolog isoform X1 [Sitophilus oryzae]
MVIMSRISTDILDFDGDVNFEDQNDFAKKYDTWRKKEELNKLKSKYGEDALDISDSSSSDDDEEGLELTEEVEKDFFKTLSCLKKKDPKLYDNNINFFKSRGENSKKVKQKKDDPMYLKDYERKIILENDGVLSDEGEVEKPQSPTYVQEQNQLKQDLKNALSNINDDDDIECLSKKAVKEVLRHNDIDNIEYKKWLAGQTDEINDDEIKSDLKPLKDFWNDPKLDDGEKFLRDYILNKKYLDKEEKDYIPSYEEIVHDSDESLSGDEKAIEEQDEFEYKYNFRYEEPDQEFIKRYPRTIEKSLRKTDDRRKLKRAETKERKQKEKEEKMVEIQKLKEIKRKEIEEKIEKLKEITGNLEVGFKNDDIEDDFDPETYDNRMQALFNDEFYGGSEEDQKPEFPDIDEELEIENWDHWTGEEPTADVNELHCEDDDFNMDADYDPSTSITQENSKSRKKRKRKSKVAEALSKEKPKYDPNDKNYEKYFEEYYNLDCEDIIGDIPCRFKYREVLPNDFGLSIEEILLAKDRELNKWCSLKKAIQHRPAHVEKYDQIAYSKKSNNISLKKKILPSLYTEENEETNIDNTPSQKNDQETTENKVELKHIQDNTIESKEKNKIGKKHKKKSININNAVKPQNEDQSQNSIGKNKKRKHNYEGSNAAKKFKKNKEVSTDISDVRLSAYGINPKKFKNKLKYKDSNKTKISSKK